MMHSKWHWVCCWRPMTGMVLWGAGMLSLVMAWVAVWQRGLVLGLEPLAWYWNALVLGVLGSGAKHGLGGDCGSCASCEVSEEKAM